MAEQIQNKELIGPGILTLDENGRILFLIGGFPGSVVATETGNVLPIEENK